MFIRNCKWAKKWAPIVLHKDFVYSNVAANMMMDFSVTTKIEDMLDISIGKVSKETIKATTNAEFSIKLSGEKPHVLSRVCHIINTESSSISVSSFSDGYQSVKFTNKPCILLKKGLHCQQRRV